MMKKKKPIVRKILLSLPSNVTHRVGVTICPHCGDNIEHEDWMKGAVAMIKDIVYGKHGSIAVIAECPKCFEKSWVHESETAFSDYMDWYPEDWKKAAKKVYAARHLSALRHFCDSLCATCVHLRNLECKTLPIIKCTYGKDENVILPGERKFYYHSNFTTQKCPAYQKREPIIDKE
jgi:hypothetical protein